VGDCGLDDILDTMREEMRKFADSEVMPHAQEWHRANTYIPLAVIGHMAELGVFGLTIPEEYGGLGLPATTYARIVMRISSVWMAITGIFNSHLMLALAIEKFGTPGQKQTWLPKLAAGDIRGGLALTEPDAGTDLQGIRMTARRAGKIHRLLADGPQTAYDLATQMWGNVAATQAFLTISEVLGHLDLLIADGRASEDDSGAVTLFEALDP